LLAQKKRRRSDESLLFWRAGLVLAPVVLFAATAAIWFDDPRLPILFGWLAIWGWAGLIVHGMLTRILPFLVWFHRFAHLAGLAPIPPMRRLLPDKLARAGFIAHLTTLLLGVWAILALSGWAARLTGVGLCVTGILLVYALIYTLRYPVPTVEEKEEESGSING